MSYIRSYWQAGNAERKFQSINNNTWGKLQDGFIDGLSPGSIWIDATKGMKVFHLIDDLISEIK